MDGPGTEEPVAESTDPPDLSLWVHTYGDQLFRYAIVRVGDREAARDLVQETFLAAVRARGRFAGRSSPGTWLTGILKHKIVDHFRKRSREPADAGLDPEEGRFQEDGRWKDPPALWKQDPSLVLGRRQFWEILHRCLAELPPRRAGVFTLRELEGLATEELCKQLEITPTNLWVLLHRARLALRECLEQHGFGGGEVP